jgi:hypothetical protein
VASRPGRAYKAAKILAQLDACAADYTFPMLDNGYFYPADVRLTAFRDERHWAIVIEVVGYSPRGGRIEDAVHRFGNCLDRKPGTSNDDFLERVSDDDGVFEEERVKKSAKTLVVRRKRIPIPRARAAYKAHGIRLEEPPDIEAFELLRVLVPEHRDLFLANAKELRKHLPVGLPVFLRLEEWFHPDLCNGEIPSQNPTFQAIARALETGDPDEYRPSRRPNTHWRHWPEGGTL